MAEYYTLDDSLRRDTVIEGWDSFIWTERFQKYGDFQIVIKSTLASRRLLTIGTRVAKAGSTYVGTIITTDDKTDDNGSRILTVTGVFMEALLDDRVAMPALTDTTTQPNWVLTDTPGNIIRTMFTTICVSGALDAKDTIPFYHSGTILPSGGIPEDSSIITVSAQPATLYSTISQIALAYFLGFRFVRNGDTGHLYFEVYTGSDLTSDQTDMNPVIFDSDMDNLESPEFLQSTSGMKNVAYVFAKSGAQMVYAVDGDPDATGADRHVLLINSSNDSDAGPDLDSALQSEGIAALAQLRQVYAFGGELPQQVPYTYGVDYKLGDLVEERNSDGFGTQMLVTEQIFVSDDTGDHSYPTLTVKQIITPGTWLVEDPDLDWVEVPESTTWDNVTT